MVPQFFTYERQLNIHRFISAGAVLFVTSMGPLLSELDQTGNVRGFNPLSKVKRIEMIDLLIPIMLRTHETVGS